MELEPMSIEHMQMCKDISYKQTDPEDIEQALQLILDAAENAEQVVLDGVEAQMQLFHSQMRVFIGVENAIIADEPYLEFEVANFHLQYLKMLERLLKNLERSLNRKQEGDYSVELWEVEELQEIKAISPNAPLLPQMQERLDKETERFDMRVRQKLDSKRQPAFGIHNYIWRSQDDRRVRHSHAVNDDKMFAWADPPATGHPGEDFGCRCTAEPTLEGAGEPRVEVVSIGAIVKILGQIGKSADRIKKSTEKISKTFGKKPTIPRLNDTKTWPRPPRSGRFKEGNPSRAKPRNRGEKSLYDEEGGEWRYNPGDSFHNPHWDYKSSGRNSKWENIPIDNLPPRK